MKARATRVRRKNSAPARRSSPAGSPRTDLARRYEALIAATGCIVYEHDYVKGSITWRGTVRKMLGCTPRELGTTSDSWLTRIHPADAPAVLAELGRAVAGRRDAQLEYRFRAGDGSYRWLLDRGTLEFGPRGKLVRVIGVMRDVTERRLAERERDNFFDLSIDLLCVAGTDRVFRRVNPAFTRVLGYSEAELTARPYTDFVHQGDLNATVAEAGRLATGQQVLKFDNRYVCKDGSLRWLSWNAVLNPDDGLIYAVARDMTDQKELERHDRLMTRELDHRVKNTLASVLAIVEHTREGVARTEDFTAALEGRLRAIATAHELLARSRWSGADLEGAASGILAPFAGRCDIRGPFVMLPARAAPVVCMTLHELAVNAAKHGAFSVPGGRVEVSWTVETGHAPARLRLVWQERGGPRVSPPARRGYGTGFIENGVAYELGGSSSLVFGGSGVRCELVVPLPDAPDPGAAPAPLPGDHP